MSGEYLTSSTGVNLLNQNIVSTGWASFVDTQYDSDNKFTLQVGIDTILPNNAGFILDEQKPIDFSYFYQNGEITGRKGDNLDIQIYFKAVPTHPDQWLDVWIDIGGSIGELYRQTFTFPKGNGEVRGIMYSLSSGYTYSTWQENSGKVYIRTNYTCYIYRINFNFDRSHKSIKNV